MAGKCWKKAGENGTWVLEDENYVGDNYS